MVTAESQFCHRIRTEAPPTLLYDQYHVGSRDEEGRRRNLGKNNWTGPESIQNYTGKFLQNTMHGCGEYRWRQLADYNDATYEGYFYVNCMHGYGMMSYSDGRVFTGLYHSNMRWGPGIESYANRRNDVGLWRGTQLLRLAWQPRAPSITPDFTRVPGGKAYVETFRVLLATATKDLVETNSAIELLKSNGLEPKAASEKWKKLYPPLCDDTTSKMFQNEFFFNDYYKNNLYTLEEIDSVPEVFESSEIDLDNPKPLATKYYYSWNNNKMETHMMKHSYQHDHQRSKCRINLEHVLSGPRMRFRRPGDFELHCRTLLQASYLGLTANVTHLVNKNDVHPNISDIQGNSAVMYATCGDQTQIINFLVQAGADVDSFNDNCCTPLGVGLMRFLCTLNEVCLGDMAQVLIQPPEPAALKNLPPEPKIFDWNINRDIGANNVVADDTNLSIKNTKSNIAPKTLKPNQGSGDASKTLDDVETEDTVEDVEEMKHPYHQINDMFCTKVNEISMIQEKSVSLKYIFDIRNMIQDVDVMTFDKVVDDKQLKRGNSNKALKDAIKPSKDVIYQSAEKEEYSSIDSSDRAKKDTLARITLTILQLLASGADPKLVRCPQPALFMAVVSGNADLIHHLINYGADVNQKYENFYGYTPIDVAIARSLPSNNIDVIRMLLECGADVSHRLDNPNRDEYDIPIPGPTLLHAVLARKPENEYDEDILLQILELLVAYNCDSLVQYRGHSALEVAMMKDMNTLDVFIKSSNTNINGPINNTNQSVLVKMFSLPFFINTHPNERLQTLTNLLLYGADPLLECYEGENKYQNLFVYAKEVKIRMEKPQKNGTNGNGKIDPKEKKLGKEKSKTIGIVPSLRGVGGAMADYQQALDLVVECARLLHIRWIQAQLVKELCEVIDKFKHRHWSMIIREHKSKKRAGLWLTTQRCLEIWEIFKKTKKKMFKDKKVLNYLLCIVHYYCKRIKANEKLQGVTAPEKDTIETDVACITREHNKVTQMMTSEVVPWKRHYVKPELAGKDDNKFNICFECAMPLIDNEKILCLSCKLVAYCSMDCMKTNVDRFNCHPCSAYLKGKYFPEPESSEDLTDMHVSVPTDSTVKRSK